MLPKKINREANCGSCRRGENTVPADWYVTGTMIDGHDVRPYRAYLCHDHLDMMIDDGLDVKTQVRLGDER